MDSWFQAYSDYPFQLFGTSHIIALLVFAAGTFLLATLSKASLRSRRIFSYVRFLLLAFLALSEISYQYWAFSNGLWDAAYYLPIHLCGIASFAGMAALITLNPKLIKLHYFIGIIPATLALITPDLLYDYHHFRFWKFFIHHMAIPWSALFLVWTTPVAITWKTTGKAYVWLLCYALAVSVINAGLGSNYLYTAGPPGEGTLLDYMGAGVWYYINLGLIALASFVLLFLAYKLFTKGKEDRQSEQSKPR